MSREEIWNKAKSYAYSVVDDKTDGDRMNQIMSAYLRGWCDSKNAKLEEHHDYGVITKNE